MGHIRNTLITTLAVVSAAAPLALATAAGAETDIVDTVELAPGGDQVDVAHDPETGRSVVVWQLDGDIEAVLLDADGDVLHGPVDVASPPGGRDARRPVVERSDDAWLVAFESDEAPSADDEYEIRTRYLTDDLLLGPTSAITTAANAAQDEVAPELAWLPGAGQFVVTWHGSVPFGGGRFEAIRARPLTALGAPDGPQTTVMVELFATSDDHRISHPAIGSNPDGSGALVAAFGDLPAAGLGAGEFELIARAVDAEGQPTDPVRRVSHLGVDGAQNNSSALNVRTPSVAALGDGYLVASRGDDGDGERVFGRLVDPAGLTIDTDEQPLLDDRATYTVEVTSDGDGGAIIATTGSAGGDTFTLAQRVTTQGSSIAATTDIAVIGTPLNGAVDVAGDEHRAVVAYVSTSANAVIIEESTPVVVPPPADADGYWMVEADGSLHAFGDAPNLPDVDPAPASQVIDLDVTPSGAGLWALDSSGTVHALGDATFLGDAVGVLPAGESPIALAPTPSGDGYWIFSDAGRVLTFGDAAHHGDLLALSLNGPIIDAVPTVTGDGYWMLGTDGGVFALGDATFHGSTGDMVLNEPAVGLVPDPDGEGYWFVASDGGVFAFDADFLGSMGGTPLNAPVVGMISYGDGYAMVATDGGAFVFSTEPFLGSLGSTPLDAPVTALTALG